MFIFDRPNGKCQTATPGMVPLTLLSGPQNSGHGTELLSDVDDTDTFCSLGQIRLSVAVPLPVINHHRPLTATRCKSYYFSCVILSVLRCTKSPTWPWKRESLLLPLLGSWKDPSMELFFLPGSISPTAKSNAREGTGCRVLIRNPTIRLTMKLTAWSITPNYTIWKIRR